MIWFLFCALIVAVDWRHTASTVVFLDDMPKMPERDYLAEELARVFDAT